ncbi:MAG: DUF4493 domain-containing protein [Alistipes sp.]|nr:DUF4493 domain-containing protein [Alistipes sp.]
MKSIFRTIITLSVAALVSTACNKDKAQYNIGPDNDRDNIGYLSLGGLEATVMTDTENISSGTTAAATRAGVPDIDTFTVTLTDPSGQTVAEFLYGERPSSPIELPGGVYTLTMSSGTMPAVDWETPVYGASREVIVTRKQTTTVNDIVCKLTNIKVTVDYSADLIDQFDAEHTSMSVSLQPNSTTFAMGETRAAYFTPANAENTLHLVLSCRYKGQDSNIDMTADIHGVKAAQWRKINVVIQHSSDGTALIGITCDTWTYDEEIVFDSASYMCEPTISDDDDLPTIVWPGHDLAEPFELTDEMFDADGVFTGSINIDIEAESPLKSLTVSLSSDNADFLSEYSSMIPATEDLCNPNVSKSILQLLGYPASAAGQSSVRLRFGAQAALMHTYEGTHAYTVTATDDKGRTASATLTVKAGSGSGSGSSIVWVGHDISQRYEITDDLQVGIRVSVPAGIKDFYVDIISDVLTPEELTKVGLTDHLNLVTPGQFKDQLEGLGFPTEDAVYGQTLIDENTLNISSFMSLLKITGQGTTDFRLTVIDFNDQKCVGTIMLEVK